MTSTFNNESPMSLNTSLYVRPCSVIKYLASLRVSNPSRARSLHSERSEYSKVIMLSYQGAGRSLNHVSIIAGLSWFVKHVLHTVTMLFSGNMCECGYQWENRGPKSSLTQRIPRRGRGVHVVVVLINSWVTGPNGLGCNLIIDLSIPINDWRSSIDWFMGCLPTTHVV